MIKISCFCTGTTFPNGEATTNRIIMIGKAFQLKDVKFTIYLNSEGNKNPLNDQQTGSVDGLEFIHLSKSMAIGLSPSRRMWNFFIVGFYGSLLALKQIGKEKGHVVYLYSHGSIYNVWVSVLAKLFGVGIIQEVNEWPDESSKKRLHKFIYKKIMFRWAKGALVISDNIELQVQRYKRSNSLKTFMLPVLADGSEWKNPPLSIEKTFVWCGLIEGYFKDVVFMINAFSKIHKDFPGYKLIICGKYMPETAKRISVVLESLDIPVGKLELTGFISNETLANYCRSATALISPLWNDQASIARFPTKISSFLFSGRPVITCNIGEVGKHLKDNSTALFYKQSDENDLAEKMKKMAIDPDFASTIGEQGRKLAFARFDYHVYADQLVHYVDSLELPK